MRGVILFSLLVIYTTGFGQGVRGVSSPKHDSYPESIYSLAIKLASESGATCTRTNFRGIDTCATSSDERIVKATSFVENKFVGSHSSTLSGLNVTTLSDGLSKFLVKRTKQELTISAFEKFNTVLQNEKIYMSYLLPNTKQKLQVISDEIYSFDQYIHGIRDAFRRDLNSLPQNLQTLLLLDTLKSGPILKPMLLDGLYLSQRIVDKDSINLIINEFLSGQSYILESDSNQLELTQGIIRLSGLLWSSLLNSEGQYISGKQLFELLRDETARCKYFELIYCKAQNTTYGARGKSLIELLPSDTILETKLRGLILVVDELNSLIAEGKKREIKGEKIDYADYAKYVSCFVDIIEFGYGVAKLNNPKVDPLPGFFGILDNGSSLALKIKQGQYSSAVLDLKKILDVVFTVDTAYYNDQKQVGTKQIRELRSKVRDTRNISTASVEKEHNESKESIKESKLSKKASKEHNQSNKKRHDLLGKVINYAAFVAAVAEASDGEEVADAIETFALPAGSSVTKRNSSFTLSLNAYTGGFYGYETLSVNNKDEHKDIASLTAPVGVGISTGYSYKLCKKVNHNSLNAFVSLIDVGAIFAYRFDDDQTEELPEITLENIFAPGLFVETSLFNSPFTLGLGHQWSPGIRKITPIDGMPPALETSHNARRWIVSLKLDLPLAYLVRSR